MRGGEVVANASVMWMRVVVSGHEVRGAQIGAVGCVPEARGGGLVRELLQHVLTRCDASVELTFLYANDTVLEMYPRFGFRRAPESAFELERRIEPAPPRYAALDVEDRTQVAAWLSASARAVPICGRFGAREYGSAALWNVCNFYRRDVHVLEEGETYVVARRNGDVLHLVDVVASRPFDLLAALPRLITEPVSRIRFGFSPERWVADARAVGPTAEALFVRGAVPLPKEPFLLPVLAQA